MNMSTFTQTRFVASANLAAVEDEPRSSTANFRLWYRRGRLLAEQGSYEAALNSFDLALELQPQDHKTWIFRGVMLAHLKLYQSALDSFDRAIELEGNDRAAWIFRGAVLTYLKKHDQAFSSYRMALNLQKCASSCFEDYPLWHLG
jgi:tetratricopeptide (TPR) repeat protein